jgi:hypothetical protein
LVHITLKRAKYKIVLNYTNKSHPDCYTQTNTCFMNNDPWNSKDLSGKPKIWTWLDNDRPTLWRKNLSWYIVPYTASILGLGGKRIFTYVAIAALAGVIISLLIAIPWVLTEYYGARKGEITPANFRLALFIHLGMLVFSVLAAVGMFILLNKING